MDNPAHLLQNYASHFLSKSDAHREETLTARPSDKDPSLIVSSEPLGWPNIVVERKILRAGRLIDLPRGFREHSIFIWDEPIGCTMTVGGVTLPLAGLSSPVVVVPARRAVKGRPRSTARYTKLRLTPAFVTAIGRDMLGTNSFTLQASAIDADQDLRAIADLLAKVVTEHHSVDNELVDVLAAEAAVNLICKYARPQPPATSASGRIATSRLIRVLLFIAEHLPKPLPVALLARQAGLSQAHFSRGFRAATGQSPHGYVRARRVALASHMLLNTTLSLDQIANRCGFYDQSHLNRTMRRLVGRTPGKFRAKRDA